MPHTCQALRYQTVGAPDADGGYPPNPGEHYANIEMWRLRDLLKSFGFVDIVVSENTSHHDVYAIANAAVTWAVVSAATGPYLDLLAIAESTHQRYAEAYGMEYEQDTGIMGTHGYPPSWWKIPLLKDALKTYEGVLWIDADALFRRVDIDIREVAKKPWNWVVNNFSVPWRTDTMYAPCCGVLALTPEAVPILDAVWALRDKYRDHPWWEQAAAYEVTGWIAEHPDCRWVGETPLSPLVGELGLEWDSMPANMHPNPICFHASGLATLGERKRLMKEALGAGT